MLDRIGTSDLFVSRQSDGGVAAEYVVAQKVSQDPQLDELERLLARRTAECDFGGVHPLQVALKGPRLAVRK